VKKLSVICIALFALVACSPASDKPVKPLPSPVAKVAPPSSDAPVVAAKDDIPAGHKLLIRFARVKAAEQLAKKENISRAAARDRIDEITDTDIHAVLKASPAIIKAMPVGGKLTDFLEWVADHKEVIMAIVAIIMAFFGG
jgi:hypothetical protein